MTDADCCAPACELPELSPAHRLDRLTAGLVLFTVRPGERGAYQRCSATGWCARSTRRWPRTTPRLALPRTVRSRIVKERGVIAAHEVPGEPNAVTPRRTRSTTGAGSAATACCPRTGQTHQLRVHMNALGVPILGDPLYPVVTDPAPAGDFRRPLQLLARVLEFTDPVTGEARASSAPAS